MFKESAISRLVKEVGLEAIPTPWSTVGYLTYKRTYSRPLDAGRTEDFPDSINRVIGACDTQLKCGFDEDEENRLRYYFKTLKKISA